MGLLDLVELCSELVNLRFLVDKCFFGLHNSLLVNSRKCSISENGPP